MRSGQLITFPPTYRILKYGICLKKKPPNGGFLPHISSHHARHPLQSHGSVAATSFCQAAELVKVRVWVVLVVISVFWAWQWTGAKVQTSNFMRIVEILWIGMHHTWPLRLVGEKKIDVLIKILIMNHIPSQSLTWNLRMAPWNMKFL